MVRGILILLFLLLCSVFTRSRILWGITLIFFFFILPLFDVKTRNDKNARKGLNELKDEEGRRRKETERSKQFERCCKSAEQGDATAQFLLGAMYADGRGVAQDDVTAVEWYRKSAEQGDTTAQLYLGAMYAVGRGVAQDDVTAVEWYRKSAEQGDTTAQLYLGAMYAVGRGVAQDDVTAVEWYRRSAEQGNAPAQCNLGVAYMKLGG